METTKKELTQGEFVEQFEQGRWRNLYLVQELPAHHSDPRGDRHLAIVVKGDDAGSFVDLVWEDRTIRDVEIFNGAKFAWNGRWIMEGGLPPRPGIMQICEFRRNLMATPRDIASRLRAIAETLDPQIDEEEE